MRSFLTLKISFLYPRSGREYMGWREGKRNASAEIAFMTADEGEGPCAGAAGSSR